MGEFDPARYGPAVAKLLSPLPLMDLGPGRPNAAMRAALEAFDPVKDFALPVTNRDAAAACVAGLWLLHDFWDESHAIAQDLATPEGSYWHAIQHRREPDPGNAKYWLRRLGVHPIHGELGGVAADLGLRGRGWDGIAFVDLCEQHRGTGTAAESSLRTMQLAEWTLLFDYCYQHATDRG